MLRPSGMSLTLSFISNFTSERRPVPVVNVEKVSVITQFFIFIMGEKCCKCDNGFIQCLYLQIHEKIHTVEKPYKCEEHGKGFSYELALNIH